MRFAVFALLGVVSAASRVVHESRPSIPHGWSAVGPSDPGTELELVVAVRQRRLDELERILLAVSDPDSMCVATGVDPSILTACRQRVRASSHQGAGSGAGRAGAQIAVARAGLAGCASLRRRSAALLCTTAHMFMILARRNLAWTSAACRGLPILTC